MALSGNGVVFPSWGSTHGQKFYWRGSQNIAGNYTDITVDVYAYFTYYATLSIGSRANSEIMVAGEWAKRTYPAVSKLSYGVSEIYLASYTKRVYHNANGTLSNVTLGSWWTIEATINGTYRSVMDCRYNTGPINTIPRQANITGGWNFTDEGTPYITFNNAGGFSIDTWIAYNGVVYARRNNIANNGKYTWTLTEAERNQFRALMPNSNSITAQYLLGTKVNGTMTWWSSRNVTITLVNGNPTFTDFSYRDNNSTTVGVTGNNQIFIRGKSSLLVAISDTQKMIANKSATPKNYSIEVDGKTVSVPYVNGATERVIGSIDNANNKNLTVRAIDSRNNVTARNKTLNVVDYNKPKINATATRLNEFENQTTLKVSGEISLVTIGNVNKNNITSLQYRRRESGGTWSGWLTLKYAMNGNKFTATDVTLSLDNTKGFEFEIRCIDKLDQDTISRSVGIGVPSAFLDVLKSSLGIGMFPEYTNSVEALGQMYQNNGKKVLDETYGNDWLKARMGSRNADNYTQDLNTNYADYEIRLRNLVGRSGESLRLASDRIYVEADGEYLIIATLTFSAWNKNQTYCQFNVKTATDRLALGLLTPANTHYNEIYLNTIATLSKGEYIQLCLARGGELVSPSIYWATEINVIKIG